MNDFVKKSLIKVNFFLAGFIAGIVFAIISIVISSGAAPASDSPLPTAGRSLTGGLQFLRQDGTLNTELRTLNSELRQNDIIVTLPSIRRGGSLIAALPDKQSAAIAQPRPAIVADEITFSSPSSNRQCRSPVSALPNFLGEGVRTQNTEHRTSNSELRQSPTQCPPEARQGQAELNNVEAREGLLAARKQNLRQQGRCTDTPAAFPAYFNGLSRINTGEKTELRTLNAER